MDHSAWSVRLSIYPRKRHLGFALVLRCCFFGAMLHGQFGVAIYIRAAVANKTAMAHPSATGKNAAKVVPAPVGQVVKVMPVAAKVTSFLELPPQSGKHSCQYRQNPKNVEGRPPWTRWRAHAEGLLQEGWPGHRSRVLETTAMGVWPSSCR